MSLLLPLSDDGRPGADISFNGPMLAMPYSLRRLGFTYTRNSAKTVYQNNALVTLAANQFGTTYDSVTGLHAFEAEPAATNLALNSILAGGGAAPTSWTQPAGTGTSAPVASIYGAASGAIAYLQTATAQRPVLNQEFSVSANTTYTLSVLIEDVTGTVAANNAMQFIAPPAEATIAFQVCSANPLGGDASTINAGVLVVRLTVAATAGTVSCRVGLGATSSATGTLQFSRPQFETGLRRTSWIATTGGTVTRAADVLSTATANLPGFNAAGYTLVVDGRADVSTDTLRYSASVNDGTANNFAAITRQAASTVGTETVSGGVSQAAVNEVSPGTARWKVAYSVAANSFLRAVNGTAGTADVSGAVPVAPTTLNIGHHLGASQTNGLIYGFKLITTALNQAQTTGQTA